MFAFIESPWFWGSFGISLVALGCMYVRAVKGRNDDFDGAI